MNSIKFSSMMAVVAVTASMMSASQASATPYHVSEDAIAELALLTSSNPFPSGEIAPIDPIYKKKFDKVLVGPAFKSKDSRGNFDYYRYVTFYNVDTRKERIYSLPIQREECHDQSELFASYSYAYTFSSSLTASISIEGLGLSAGFTKSRTFTTGRNIRATGKIIADHTPYFIKQDWSGYTYIQTYNSKTKRVGFLVKESKESTEWWVQFLFPALAHTRYPMNFKAKDADWTFIIERTLIGKCESAM